MYDHTFIYTGQHYSPKMRDIFFDELEARKPDYSLDISSSDHSKLTDGIYSCLEKDRPSYVIVYGDTNSTDAGAKAAKKVNSKLIHLEAGLRCFDERIEEERNRKFVDSISDYFITPTHLTEIFLKYEGHENIYVTGNPIVDVCAHYLPKALERKTKEELSLNEKFLLATIHRQENVDDPLVLSKLVSYLSKLDEEVVFPVHPRTVERLREYGIELPKNVKATEPLGYLDFLNLLYSTDVVLTDSGGVEEEAITLKKPCITLREKTERQETILIGANKLFHLSGSQKSQEPLYDVVEEMKNRSEYIKSLENPYGEGVTQKIVEAIEKILGE